ncbi:MAG: S-layer homology domain-containing protein [Clostridia bacterium]|nr:S-layer homology domain-containing protein [Clostridia bacterium]
MKTKRILSLLLSIIMILSMAPAVVLADNEAPPTQFASSSDFQVEISEDNGNIEEAPDIYQTISEGIATSTDYLQEQLTELHKDGGVPYGFEWYIIALLRAGKDIDEDILGEYYESVAAEVETWTADVKPTDAERTALALTIMGKDITDVDGVDLAALIYNSTKLNESSNELAYALLALDAANVVIPDTAVWNREKIIAELLKFQAADGGFGLTDNNAGDVDMTAICLQALAPYQDEETVATSIDDALTYLKDGISADYNYANNSNTTAQVLLALASLGIDATDSDNGFGDSNYNIITALNEYRNAEGDGYLYGDKVNSMSTVQIMQAYDAYRKAHKEDISYWDFTAAGAEYDDTSSGDGSNSGNEDATSATVYVTIASEGTVVTDKNGGYMAQAPVTVTDRDENGILTVDETLYAAHETYYPGGADAGYSAYTGAYGLSLAILWGHGTEGTTATAGYWLNNASCWSLADEVKDGDYLTAFNYYDAIGWSDAYSYFAQNEVSVTAGESVKLTLNYLSGYDIDNYYAPIFSAYSGANVVFLGSNNNIQKPLTTDTNGQVSISFTKAASAGSYYVMAYADDSSIVPAVCKINVTAANAGGSGSGADDSITVYIRVADPKGKTYLSKKPYSIKDGDSAFDLLDKTGLDVDTTRSAYGVYVKSIEGLAEFDEGAESGWLYRVNGVCPNYSASLYTLSEGDYVEWLYTRDLGKDIGDNSFRGSSGGSITTYNVKFETNGGNSINSQSISKNGTVTKPTTPTKDGYTFVGWYTDKDLTTEYDFSARVTSGFTLYAKWTEDEKSTENNAGAALTTFTDVETGAWYEGAVAYAVENNLFKGISETEFAPDSAMTRAMLVTVLYRLENPTEKERTHSFADVADGEWYTEAVSWAAESGVVNGVNETAFAPEENITREQMATILFRYAQFKGYDTASTMELSQFTDFTVISDWALSAQQWANASGLIQGTSETTLAPQDTATRAQVATILKRFCEMN